MRNVDVKATKKQIVITINLDEKVETSDSGKSLVIATTHGNQRITDDGWICGLTVYKKNPEYVKESKTK